MENPNPSKCTVSDTKPPVITSGNSSTHGKLLNNQK